MRIAYLSYEYPPDSTNGGIATYVGQAARTMAERGHDVEVFASSGRRQCRLERQGVIEHWVRETDSHDFAIAAGHIFAQRHAERRFDVLEGPEYHADARVAVDLVPDIPLVVKMHTPSLIILSLNARSRFQVYLQHLLGSGRGVAAALLRRRSLPPISFVPPLVKVGQKWNQMEAAHALRADIVASPCHDLCSYARKAWKVPDSAIRHCPYPYTPAKELLALGPRADGRKIGFFGRLEKRKGIEVIAKAIPAIAKAVPDARFCFVGDVLRRAASSIYYDEWMRSQMPRYADRLEFLGKYSLEQMPEAYGSVDICVFPSLWENFPNVCLEAMSAGKAIVASSAGGMREMLDYGRVGRLIQPADYESLARDVIALLKHPLDRASLGELARSRVMERYNGQVIGEKMENIYLEAIERKAARRN